MTQREDYTEGDEILDRADQARNRAEDDGPDDEDQDDGPDECPWCEGSGRDLQTGYMCPYCDGEG